MSDTAGPGWWQASDGKWYPPQTLPGQQPPPGYPVGVGGGAPRRTNTKAVVSLVLGIVSIFVCYLGWILGVVAIILGAQARRAIAAARDQETGDGMAIAGIATGAISLLWLLAIAAIIAITFLGESSSERFSSVGSAIN